MSGRELGSVRPENFAVWRHTGPSKGHSCSHQESHESRPVTLATLYLSERHTTNGVEL